MQQSRKFLIYLLFIASGATSLVYQSVWVRLLSLSVGSTSASISLVLAIFFFGLALGSFIAGRISASVARPIRLYGLIEGAIGIYSLALVYVFLNLHIPLTYVPHQGTWAWVGTATKLIVVALLLLPPTIGMGASLPLLVRVFREGSESVGRKVSVLYFINTLGAVFGAFSGSFLLIPTLGVVASNHLAASGNLAILAVAWFMDRGTSSSAAKVTPIFISAAEKWSWRSLSTSQSIILLVAFATGFSSIAAEVVWNKYLGIFFGTNIYGLGIILSIFLAGIAFGSLALSRMIDVVSSKSTLFLALLTAAVLTLIASSHALNYLPLAANIAAYYSAGAVNLLTIKSLLSAIVIFPPTLVFGALFPLGVDLLSSSAKDAPAVVGLAYAINTVGAIIGSYLGGMVLIPLLGSSGAVSVAVVLLALVAALAFSVLGQAAWTRRIGPAALATIAIFAAVFGNIEFRNIIKSAYFQALQPALSFSEVTKYFARDYEEFVMIHEGKTAIISLSQDPKDGANYKDYFRLKTNGLNESIYNRQNLDLVPKYEGLLGMLPYALHENVQNAFVVGYGGGYTVGLLTRLGIPNVHVAELEAGIIAAAQHVYQGKNPILQRPNLKLTIEDARFVMATKQGGPYDIILSQPSHSWLSGVANLFTREFFEIVRGNLTERGVFSQWLNLYNMDERVLRSIMRTFFETFPHGFVFTDRNNEELIMIGSLAPVKFDIQRLAQLTADEGLRTSLVGLPFSSPEDFVSNFATTRAAVLAATADAPINTDVNAYAEVNQSALFYLADEVAGKPQAYLSKIYSGNLHEVATNFPSGDKNFYYATLLSLQQQSKFFKFSSIYEAYQKLIGESAPDLQSAGYLAMRAQRYGTAQFYLTRSMQLAPSSQGLDFEMANLIEMRRWSDAADLYRKHAARAGDYASCYYVEALVQLGDSRAIEALRRDSKKFDFSQCGIYGQRVKGKLAQAMGDWQSAVAAFEAYYLQYPQDVAVVERLTSLHLLLGNHERGREFAEYLPRVHKERLAQLDSLTSYYRERGYLDDVQILSSLQSVP